MWAARLASEASHKPHILAYAHAYWLSKFISLANLHYLGKDSLSMAAKVGDEVVKAPGSLVIPIYCTVKDITKKVLPTFC